mgnify:CR=1 FL=1
MNNIFNTTIIQFEQTLYKGECISDLSLDNPTFGVLTMEANENSCLVKEYDIVFY